MNKWAELIEDQIIEEIDYVMNAYCTTFSNQLINFSQKKMRRKSASKQLKDYLKSIGNTSANPLIKKIYDILWIKNENEFTYNTYYSIYKRNYKKTKNKRAGFDYDYRVKFNQYTWNREYNCNKIIPDIDEVVYGYPPLLEWIYINEVKSGDKDLLSYYAEKRYAIKTNTK